MNTSSLDAETLSYLSMMQEGLAGGDSVLLLVDQGKLLCRFLPHGRILPESFLIWLAGMQGQEVHHLSFTYADGADMIDCSVTVRNVDGKKGRQIITAIFPDPEVLDHEFTILDQVPYPMLLLLGGKIIHGNRQARTFFAGLDLVGGSFTAIFEPASAALFEQLSKKTFTTAIRDIEANVLAASGICTVAVSMNKVLLSGTNYDMAVVRDLTVAKKYERSLRESDIRYRSLTENMRDVVWIMDSSLVITWASPLAQAFFGCTMKDILGKHVLEFATFNSRTNLASHLSAEGLPLFIKSSQGRAIIEFEFNRPNDLPLWSELSLCFIDEGSGLVQYLGVARDISERKAAHAQLGQSEDKFRRILERFPVPIIMMLHDWSIEKVNAKFTELFGWTKEEVPHLEVWWEKSFPDLVERELIRSKAMDMVGNAALNNRESPPFTMKVLCRNGEERILESRFIYLVGHGIWAFTDITELHRKEERLHLYATTDELTGIHNRRTGIAILERAMEHCRAAKLPLSICYLDINNLKHANDNYGHGEGDALILIVVEAITSTIRRSDTLCRMGGDEFLIVFPECDLPHAEAIVANISNKIGAYNQTGQKSYEVGFSYGMETMQEDQTLLELVALADKNMYAEKRRFHMIKQD